MYSTPWISTQISNTYTIVLRSRHDSHLSSCQRYDQTYRSKPWSVDLTSTFNTTTYRLLELLELAAKLILKLITGIFAGSFEVFRVILHIETKTLKVLLEDIVLIALLVFRVDGLVILHCGGLWLLGYYWM